MDAPAPFGILGAQWLPWGIMEILILVALIVLNGLFAMSEIAIVTARKTRLAALAQSGSSAAATALKLAEDPTQFLSTVQVGITSIGVLSGIFGEAILAGPFALWLQDLGLAVETSTVLATVLVVVVVTYVSIVVGELVPKRIGQISPETIACLVAPPMQMLAIVARPFIWLLSQSTHLLLQVLRFSRGSEQNVTHEDIQAMLQEGSSSGVIEPDEHTMVRNVFRLDERRVSSLMVPRQDIVFLDVELPLEDNLRRVVASPHSRFPVCRGEVDELLGVISTRELLGLVATREFSDLASAVQHCDCVPDSLNGLQLLEHFRRSGHRMVLVVDEYGELRGLVTLQDVLDVLAGEFVPADGDEDPRVVQRADGSLLLDGLLPIIDLKDHLGVVRLPREEEGNYQTLNGLIMLLLDKIPRTADQVEVEGWLLEIVDMDGRRIDKVLATRLTPAGARGEHSVAGESRPPSSQERDAATEPATPQPAAPQPAAPQPAASPPCDPG